MSLGTTLRVIGGALVVIGVVLGLLLRSGEAARERGLDRPLRLSPFEQFELLGRNPRVFVPLNLVMSGILLLLASLVFSVARWL